MSFSDLVDSAMENFFRGRVKEVPKPTKDVRLSNNFLLSELTRSFVAIRHGIDNTPNESQIENIKQLCLNVLQPIRDGVKRRVNISSGFRILKLNRKLKSKDTSHHRALDGYAAADFTIDGMTVEEAYQWIKNSGIEFDQLIQEFDGWVHVSYSTKRENRRICVRAVKTKNNKLKINLYLVHEMEA